MAVAFDPLIIEPVDRRDLDTEIAAALGSASTRIFLDTNILMWTYSLHLGARTDLCDWLTSGPQASRIHIPRRVIHEFSAHRDRSDKLYPFGQEFRPLVNLLERFKQMAPLVADDAWAATNGFTDRATYLQQVSLARDTLGKLVTPITKGEKLEKLHQQLLPVFNALALHTDIFAGLASLRDAYEARAEIRMPPGYKDAKKGRASEAGNQAAGAPALAGANRFGDLAIWEEILGFVGAADPVVETVIIITHDTKPDWSYTPQKIVDSDGHTKPNPEGAAQLTVAQPLLVHELKTRTPATALYIVTIPQLAVIANAHYEEVGFKFTELARAVQIEAEEEEQQLPPEEETDAAGESGETETGADDAHQAAAEAAPAVEEPAAAAVPVGEPDIGLFLANPPAVALADGTYVIDPMGPAEFEATIKGLRSHNWYLQNPAVRDGMTLLAEGKATLLQAFIFGRNLYQAAVGTAADAMRTLEDLTPALGQTPAHLANAVYAGALFELYFDREGTLRYIPKDDQIGPLLRHQSTEFLAPAIAFIRARLEGAQARLMMMPSTQPVLRQLTLTFNADNAITAILLGDFALTAPHDEADIGASPLPEKTRLAKLRTLVSGYFSVPEYQLDLQPAFDDVRQIANLQFIHWNPIDGPDLQPA